MNRPSQPACLVLLAVGIAIGVGVSAGPTAAHAQIPPGLNESKSNRFLTPVELLANRVSALETALNAKDKALDAKDRALESKLEQLRTENAELRASVNAMNDMVKKHEFDMNSPGGMIGLRRRVGQKAGWDRIPGGAWFVYYER